MCLGVGNLPDVGPSVITIFRNQFLKSLKLVLRVKGKSGT